jgi:Fic family protein
VVRVAKRRVKGGSYFYLEHTIRQGGKRITRTKYLGSKIPKEIDDLKKQFRHELDREKWFNAFEEVKKAYLAELRRTPPSAIMKAIREFSIRFTYNTQRIEGSTLTLRETTELLEHNVSPGNRPIEDVKEAEAHHRVFLSMLEFRKDLSLNTIEEWHHEMFKDTKRDAAGKIRRHGVRISGSRFVPPSPVELQPLLREFFAWYEKSKKKIHPVELAALAHLRFVTIHPFSDGNGRISRLMMNFVLNKHQYPMLNIEYTRRGSYYTALERAQLTKDDRIFITWFFRRYIKEHT